MNYHVLNSSMVLNYDGKTVTLSDSDPKYTKVLQLIREGKLNEIKTTLEQNEFTDAGLTIIDGLLHLDGIALPWELSNRIKKFKELQLPFKPLLLFWDNLRQNPSFNSRAMLYKFLEHNGHPLTEDGHFIAYRGIREDFKDVHTGTMDNRPGSVVSVPRDQVDDNPNNTCSHGLHVACFDYAKGFGPKLVEVKVNPKDVVAVPTDYNGTKMRVSRFEVIQEVNKPNDVELYDYDDSDDEYDYDEIPF